MPIDPYFNIVIVGTMLLIAVGLVYLVWLAATRQRRGRHLEQQVVGQIAALLNQHLPLGEGLKAAALAERGLVRQRLERIAGAVTEGRPLPSALRSALPECSGTTYSLADFGRRTQSLPHAMNLADHWLAERSRRVEVTPRGSMLYALMVLAGLLFILFLMTILIVPKFEEIFADFNVALPALTLRVINLTQRVTVLGFPCAVGLLLSLAGLGALASRRRTPEKPHLGMHLADTLRWSIPGWHRLQFAGGLAIACDAMTHAVRAGLPLEQAAKAAANLDVNLHLRHRLRAFADDLHRGARAGDAARRNGLGELTAVALGAGSRGHDLASALAYAADYHDALVCRWWIVLRNIAWPLVTLILATLVGTFVLAMFMPLVTLIDSVAI
jgi:type IV pilus assembly protein PilC